MTSKMIHERLQKAAEILTERREAQASLFRASCQIRELLLRARKLPPLERKGILDRWEWVAEALCL